MLFIYALELTPVDYLQYNIIYNIHILPNINANIKTVIIGPYSKTKYNNHFESFIG